MGDSLFDIEISQFFIENCSANPRGASPSVLVFCRDPIVRVDYHPWLTSLRMDLYSAAEFISEWYDVWLPIFIISPRSYFVVSLSIVGER